MKCLDSNLLVDFLREKIEALKKMKELENEPLGTTTINVFELLYGAKISEHREQNLKEVKKIVGNLELLSFDFKAAEASSSILTELKKSGQMIEIRDIFIAGICCANNVDLVTRNVNHFKNIQGLNVEKY